MTIESAAFFPKQPPIYGASLLDRERKGFTLPLSIPSPQRLDTHGRNSQTLTGRIQPALCSPSSLWPYSYLPYPHELRLHIDALEQQQARGLPIQMHELQTYLELADRTNNLDIALRIHHILLRMNIVNPDLSSIYLGMLMRLEDSLERVISALDNAIYHRTANIDIYNRYIAQCKAMRFYYKAADLESKREAYIQEQRKITSALQPLALPASTPLVLLDIANFLESILSPRLQISARLRVQLGMLLNRIQFEMKDGKRCIEPGLFKNCLKIAAEDKNLIFIYHINQIATYFGECDPAFITLYLQTIFRLESSWHNIVSTADALIEHFLIDIATYDQYIQLCRIFNDEDKATLLQNKRDAYIKEVRYQVDSSPTVLVHEPSAPAKEPILGPTEEISLMAEVAFLNHYVSHEEQSVTLCAHLRQLIKLLERIAEEEEECVDPNTLSTCLTSADEAHSLDVVYRICSIAAKLGMMDLDFMSIYLPILFRLEPSFDNLVKTIRDQMKKGWLDKEIFDLYIDACQQYGRLDQVDRIRSLRDQYLKDFQTAQ